MATIAVFTQPAHEFPLGAVFEDWPEATVELERVVQDVNNAASYFWVCGRGVGSSEPTLSGVSGVRDVRLVDRTDSTHLMRCQWRPEADSVLDALDDPGLVMLSAVGTASGWTFVIRGETREALSDFQQFCSDHELAVDLVEIRGLRPPREEPDLTRKQRDAMVLAFERGYYESPRKTQLKEVAGELGISQQALASRLRRGTRHLIEEVLVEPDP